MKKVIITLVSLAMVIGCVYVGILIYKRHRQNSNPVNVYSLEDCGDSSWYEDDMNSMSGTISASGTQKVYLESGKEIKEIMVKIGDKVKPGQELVKYDDTQAKLELESMYNDLESSKTELTDAYNLLEKLKKVKPVDDEEKTTEATTRVTTEATTEKTTTTTTEQTTEDTSENSTENTSEVTTETTTTETATKTDADEKSTDTSTEASTNSSTEASTEKKTEATTEKKKKKKKKKTTQATTEATTRDSRFDDDDDDDYDDDDDDLEEEYTKYELSLAIKRQNEEIKNIQNDIDNQKLAIKKEELAQASQAVVAKINGTVTQILDAEESRSTGNPLILISGEGTFMATVSVGEYDLANIKLGTEVTAYCYDTGGRYPGVVTSIGLNPVGESSGSFVQSYYPVRISLDESASDLNDGSYVEVSLDGETDLNEDLFNTPTMDTSTATDADAIMDDIEDLDEINQETEDEGPNDIVIPMYFVKKEGNRYYVFKNSNGRLKKQYINTGKIYYGSEIVVTGGITSSDWLAFPYDKNVTEGKVCKEADIDDLYY